MEKRLSLTHILTVSLLILALTLSCLAVLPVESPFKPTNQDTRKILSLLESLRDNVTNLENAAFGNASSGKGRKTALENKITAVIHQIKAEAWSGSLNKLKNDVSRTVAEWILPYSPQDAELLFDIIREIMELIEGKCPPPVNPEASFFFTPETPLAGEITTFNASASEDLDGFIVSYTWDFGDNSGVTVSEPVIAHIYAKYGIYTVSLTVNDDDFLTDTESKPVKVTAPPQATFTYSPLVPLVDEVIIFNASDSVSNGGEIESGTWDFGDGITKTGEIVTHAYSAEGTYNVVLNVTDTEGLWDISAVDITVYVRPVVDLPPKIIGVFRVPQEPNYDEHVRILASVIDIEGDVESVILGYSINNIDWTNLTMTFNENIGFYSVEILPQPYNSTVDYKVYAFDDMGNWNVSATHFYTVGDKYAPVVEIEKPIEGDYLRRLVNIGVSVQEDNLVEAELLINGTAVSSWQESGQHVFIWNTSSSNYPDGIYTIKVRARDKADNSGEIAVIVAVDNTLPVATIDAPSSGAFLRQTVIIEITGRDANLKEVTLEINDSMTKTWSSAGTHILLWDTGTYSDGTHVVTLTAFDKARNSKETSITTVVDNASPVIETPTWLPEEPLIGEQVNIAVEVSDVQPGSGIRNALLSYRNTTSGDWKPIPMSLNATSGNWTATIPAQSVETMIEFYIEAFDNAGNSAVTDEVYQYEVVAPLGVPLAWVIVIVILIFAATATAIYLLRKHRREGESTRSRV